MLKLDETKFPSHELERMIVSGILRYENLYYDLSPILKSEDFSQKIHQSIWSIYGGMVNKNEKIDYHLLSLKIQELNINFGLDLEIFDYLEATYFMGVAEGMVIKYASELKKINGRKILAHAGVEVANKMIECSSELSYASIVDLANGVFNNKINIFEQGGDINQPIDIFANLEAMIESKGNNPTEEGIICPYNRLKKLYGNFTPGDLYFFIARPKAGKSTFLMNTAFQCAGDINQNVRVLYLDTELETYRVQYRLLSAITGVPEYFIRNGGFRKNKEMSDAVRLAWGYIKRFIGTIDHVYVGNQPIEEVASIARRWHKKNIPTDGSVQPLYCYDYVKLGDEFNKVGNNMRPDLVVGRKVDQIKKLATELQAPWLTSAQTNRMNEGRQSSSNRMDDGSVVGLSDQISQFSSNIYLLNRLAVDELQQFQAMFGLKATHSVSNIYSRNQGEEGPGFSDIVKIQDGDKVKWVENKFYFSFDNFKVQEISDLSTLVKERGDYNLSAANNDTEGETLD